MFLENIVNGFRRVKTDVKRAACMSLATLVLSGVVSREAVAKTYYVNPENEKCPAIQSVINDCNDGDEIIVSKGIYYENINFNGKNITLRSTDPNNQDIVARTIIDGGQNGPVVSFYNGEGYNAPCVLSGFTITNGYWDFGGGISCEGSSPTFVNCVISGNYASWDGGGMFNSGGSPTVMNCTFSENDAAKGAAVFNVNGNSSFIDCTFTQNLAHESGAGMYVWQSNPSITDCNFNRNLAVNGAGIFNQESSPTITNCNFNENEARYGYWGFGGGVYNYQSNPIIERCIMANNYAEWGGGIACNENSSPTIKNCTISGNLTYQDGGGIYCGASSNPLITNSTIVGNETEEADVAGIACFGGSAPIITYSDIQGGWPGEGNIDADPLFVNPNNGDYHLKSRAGRWDPNLGSWTLDDVTSPCIDTGDPRSPIGYEPFPNGGRINMGAYGGTAEASKSYFGKPNCETIVAGDINGDCAIDFKDFAIMASHWLEDRN